MQIFWDVSQKVLESKTMLSRQAHNQIRLLRVKVKTCVNCRHVCISDLGLAIGRTGVYQSIVFVSFDWL